MRGGAMLQMWKGAILIKVLCIFPVAFHSLVDTETDRENSVVIGTGYCNKGSILCSEDTVTQMKAVRIHTFGGPEVLQLDDDVAVPLPSQSEVLIKVLAAGINPVEAYIRQGTHSFKPKLPWIPGNDVAGVVHSIGSDVTKFRIGDRVYGKLLSGGAYAEFAVAKENQTQSLPDHISFQQGASIGIPYFTAYNAIFQRADAKPGQSILIHGASGAVGLACVQFASAHGMVVYGTAGTQNGMDLVTKHGAVKVFDHTQADYPQRIMEETNGRGVDVVIEMLANVNLQKDMEMIAEQGTIAIVGNRGNVEINPRTLMQRRGKIVGVMPNLSKDEYSEVASAIHAGLVNNYLRPYVGQEFPLNQAAEAHREVIQHNQGSQGKIVLNI